MALNVAAAKLMKPKNQPSRAYVTFLAGNGDYVKGVVGLAKGMRKVKSKYPLVVAVLPDVPEEHRKILVDQGCIVREIEPVYPPENQTQFAMAYYVINYSKLRIWEFLEYSKMIYLDGDIQVFHNIDHLFDLPNGFFYAHKTVHKHFKVPKATEDNDADAVSATACIAFPTLTRGKPKRKVVLVDLAYVCAVC
ncbi:hypothetical protein NL676_030454 [Syzygium grande]|nr:hypothetical protein NL676_030454 [Syzygium grande]